MDAGSTESVYRDAGCTAIETQNGMFNPLSPVFDINVIAHSLGQIVRYNGHANRFYTVAEHSVMVSEMMEAYGLGDPMEGLLHDATEAYLSDVPAPFKQFLPDLGKFDTALEVKLREHFGVSVVKSKGCKKADWLALFIEAFELLPSKGMAFIDPLGYRLGALSVRKDWPLRFLGPYGEASTMFLSRYQQLRRRKL